MASSNGDQSKLMSNQSGKGLFLAQILIRSVTSLLALAATLVMVKSGQSTTVFGIVFQAKYSYSSAFRFFVGTNIAVCAFSVISVIAICAFYSPKSNSISNFSLFLYDLIAMIFSMAGCAAATSIGYVGKYGQEQIGWTKICDDVTKFCNLVMLSIAFSYLAFICLFALVIIAFRHAHSLSTNLLNKD
ncbi:CASP-like protein 1F2 [Silene latifolia]|uniref:CASP-like protein 1F2 n=1 Tax=Silene latifolia TaxID=37657 RepID=UPI003D77178D